MKKLALYETGQGRWPQLIILANQLRQEEEAKQRERAKLAQARADAVAAKRAYEAPAKAAAKAAKKAVKNALILSGRRKQPGAAAGQGGGAAAGSGGRQLQQPGELLGSRGEGPLPAVAAGSSSSRVQWLGSRGEGPLPAVAAGGRARPQVAALGREHQPPGLQLRRIRWTARYPRGSSPLVCPSFARLHKSQREPIVLSV